MPQGMGQRRQALLLHLKRLSLKPFIIKILAIQNAHRIMPGDPILDRQHCDRRLGVFVEKHVMADAKAHNNIHIGLGLVQKSGLGHWIADRLKGSRPDLVGLA